MAAYSSSLLLHQTHKPTLTFQSLPTSAFKHGGRSLPLLPTSTNATTIKTSSRGKFVVRSDGSPETVAAAGDLVSSFSIPGFSDNPWVAGIVGLTVTLPFVIQRILSLTKEIDVVAGTVEKIADVVGKVAEQVDEAAEDFGESLPEGGLKKMVGMVEDLAEQTHEGADKVEELMEKVDELTDRIDEFVTQSKSTSQTSPTTKTTETETA